MIACDPAPARAGAGQPGRLPEDELPDGSIPGLDVACRGDAHALTVLLDLLRVYAAGAAATMAGPVPS